MGLQLRSREGRTRSMPCFILFALFFCAVLFGTACASVTFPPNCDLPMCPASKVLKPNPAHKPSHNGCGVPGFMVSSEYDMTECCNVHDVCYDTCGKSRSKCDQDFLDCMNKKCERWKGQKQEECKGTASMFHMVCLPPFQMKTRNR